MLVRVICTAARCAIPTPILVIFSSETSAPSVLYKHQYVRMLERCESLHIISFSQ